MRIFNYGSVNIDHVYRVRHFVQPGETLSSHDYRRVLGGKGANQSIALARAGAEVMHIGRYHHEDSWVRETLQQARVNVDYLIGTTAAPTGHAMIQVNDQGENAIVLCAGANQDIHPTSCARILDEAMVEKSDWLLLQNECSATIGMIKAAIDAGMQVAFNPAPMITDIATFPWPSLALLFVNQVEVAQLLGIKQLDLAQLPLQLQQRLPDTQVIVTLGSEGALWAYQGQQQYMPAFAVKAVDTTGAGDTFIGYYLQAMIQQKPVKEALQWACQAAALCVQQAGASTSIPTAAQVKQALGAA